MIVVSDTNILSSFAAGDAFPLLLRLFVRSQVCVPPGVHQELQAGIYKGNPYLDLVGGIRSPAASLMRYTRC